MKDATTVGVDFGTSNSMCCWFGGTGSPQPIVWHEQKGSASIPTAILYEGRNGEGWKPVEYGLTAEEEWLSLPADSLANYRYASNFKPDLAHCADAQSHAREFFQYLYARLLDPQQLQYHFKPEDELAIGIPATTIPNHAECTERIAREAGFKNVVTIPEPSGALAYHLCERHISLRDLRASVLIVDFGGGTCDFALLRRGECEHAWGDPLYGGRLFDDLFYQWLKESSSADFGRHDTYIHWVKCRKAKEEFSFKMAKNRQAQFHYHDFLGHGSLTGVTWDQFVARASQYRPTLELHRLVANGNSGRANLFADGPVNLVEWFEKSMLSGLQGLPIHLHFLTKTGIQ